ncbi:MAG: glutamate--tRNA ligase, partial [Chitinophagaceae bacterium]
QAAFFFTDPKQIDIAAIQPKWDATKQAFFEQLVANYNSLPTIDAAILENNFKELASSLSLKPGELMLPFRIMLVGGKFGPGVFEIAHLIGKEATTKRIDYCLSLLKG